jgi:hypothetical protein
VALAGGRDSSPAARAGRGTRITAPSKTTCASKGREGPPEELGDRLAGLLPAEAVEDALAPRLSMPGPAGAPVTQVESDLAGRTRVA